MRWCGTSEIKRSEPRLDYAQPVLPMEAFPFERGSLFYLLRNRFYIGEVKYKDEILPGEQPAIMERELFDAVQQKLTDQWSHRNHAKSKSDHLLTGLLYDDVGHRMIPTHATKAGIRYRYYVSLPHLKGESKTVSVGSISRIPATDVEDIIVKSVNKHLIARHDQPSSSSVDVDDRSVIAEQVVRIDVHKDRLSVRFKSAGSDEESTDGQLLSMPWRKPPSRKSRQILIPLGVPRMKSVRYGSNVERASLAQFRGVAGGLTRSSQARPLTSSRSPHAKNAACGKSI